MIVGLVLVFVNASIVEAKYHSDVVEIAEGLHNLDLIKERLAEKVAQHYGFWLSVATTTLNTLI